MERGHPPNGAGCSDSDEREREPPDDERQGLAQLAKSLSEPSHRLEEGWRLWPRLEPPERETHYRGAMQPMPAARAALLELATVALLVAWVVVLMWLTVAIHSLDAAPLHAPLIVSWVLLVVGALAVGAISRRAGTHGRRLFALAADAHVAAARAARVAASERETMRSRLLAIADVHAEMVNSGAAAANVDVAYSELYFDHWLKVLAGLEPPPPQQQMVAASVAQQQHELQQQQQQQYELMMQQQQQQQQHELMMQQQQQQQYQLMMQQQQQQQQHELMMQQQQQHTMQQHQLQHERLSLREQHELTAQQHAHSTLADTPPPPTPPLHSVPSHDATRSRPSRTSSADARTASRASSPDQRRAASVTPQQPSRPSAAPRSASMANGMSAHGATSDARRRSERTHPAEERTRQRTRATAQSAPSQPHSDHALSGWRWPWEAAPTDEPVRTSTIGALRA